MPNIRVALSTPLFLLLSSISVLSQTPCQPTGSGVCRYVSATGSDSNDGLSRATPKKTIATTVNASSPGDEIIVLAGTYNCANQPGNTNCVGGENSGTALINETASGTAANPIVLICDAYLACKLDGNTNNTAEAMEVGGGYVTVRNFEVEGFADNGLSNYRGGAYSVFARNWIHDIGRYCTATAIGRDGVFIYQSNATVTQNIISDIGRYAIGENGCNTGPQQHDHGIYSDAAQSPTNLTITNNIFYRCNRGWSIQLYPGTWNGTVSILNNTFIWGTSVDYGQIIVAANVSNLLIENNVSYQPNYSFIYHYSGTVTTGTYANNIIYGTSRVFDSLPSGFNITVTGNLVNTDPKLASVGSPITDASPSVPDAHLTLLSPAIKAGLTLAAVPVDFDGTPRIPAAYDIGSSYAYLVVPLSPNSGTGATQTFTVMVREPNGLADLNQVQLLFNAAPTRLAGCNVNYQAAENTMYLYNDDGSAFLPGVVPGSTTQVSNSQCTLKGAVSSYRALGNTLTLNVALTFSRTFTGQKNAYVYVQGNSGWNNGGWAQWGTWTP